MQNRLIKHLSFITFSTLLALFTNCQKESIYSGNEPVLRFSSDTVAFDTVFTSIGSATLKMKVFNTINEDVIINNISLAGGGKSPYRLNIDGLASNFASNVKIKAKDSLMIFVELTVDPRGVNNPFLVTDSIRFNVNAGVSQVMLTAYGQDVIKLKNSHLSTSTLSSEKPYLIYDTLFIDEGATVDIEAGTHFYMHSNSRIMINGTLKANGSMNQPIVFEGDRFTNWYVNYPGTWGEIKLTSKSKACEFNYVTIKNGTNGFLCDSIGLDGNKVEFSNLIIENISQIGFSAINSNILINNSLIGYCQDRSIAFNYGGNYQVTHCTISNFIHNKDYPTSGSKTVLLNNYYTNNEGTILTNPLTLATFENSIIWGNKNSIKLDYKTTTGEIDNGLNFTFQNCLIHEDKIISTSDTTHFKNVVVTKDPKFMDRINYNYHLDTLSEAINAGNLKLSLPFKLDYDLQDRTLDGKPDLGMYETVLK